MAELAMLDPARPDGHSEWLAAWRSWPAREVFAHPEYARAFERPQQRVLCARFKDSGGEVLFPLELRSLDREPWCPRGLGLSDLSSPYGYGGPFAWGRPSAEDFWELFRQWARRERVVSGFVRRSLFPEQLLPLPGGEVAVADNVVRSLTATAEQIWASYEHKVRKNVNKARRSGLAAQVDPRGERLRDFLRVYAATMDRRGASDFYHFPSSFFEGLFERLRDQALLCHVARAGGEVVSSELVLVSETRLYSFLGGTLAEALPLGANDLLKHAIVEWGRDQGKRSFVLGGGYQPGDGIFRYKRAFAPDGVVPFSVGRLVFDPEGYQQLVEARRAWEAARGRDWRPAPGFFPEFRAPGGDP
jgi:CelD/BcsL family acetyltransferase involved in cellulose biosynthesis